MMVLQLVEVRILVSVVGMVADGHMTKLAATYTPVVVQEIIVIQEALHQNQQQLCFSVL
jgi:hypothetical protein